MINTVPDTPQRAYARFAGLMYLLVLGIFTFGNLLDTGIAGSGNFADISARIVASETLYRVGLCCEVAGCLFIVLLALGLYVTVRPVAGNLALTALLFRMGEAVTAAAWVTVTFVILQLYLDANHGSGFGSNQLGTLVDLNSGLSVVGYHVSLVFYGAGSTVFFWLFLKSNYIPRVLSVWGIFASLELMAVQFGSLLLPQNHAFSSSVSVLYAPIGLAEVATGLWLLVMAVNVQRWRERASQGATQTC